MAGILALLVVVATAAGAGAQALDRTVAEDIGIEQRLDAQVPLDLTFRDDSGQQVRLGDLVRDRPVVLSMVYYECPMLCTQVLNGLLRALRVLSMDVGREFDIITVSIDPGETPELARAKKAEYVRSYGRASAEDGWHFLTGDSTAIETLAETVGFHYRYDDETDLYVHSAGIMVLTPAGKLARYFYGIEYSPKDMRLGLVEAADERIGSPVDQVLLLCLQYDPETGKYGLVIMSILRLAGGATLLLMATLVIAWIRRDRRLQRAALAGADAPHGRAAGPPSITHRN